MGTFIKLENFSKMVPYVDMFKEGLIVTVLLAFFTVIIGFVLALVLALMRMSNFRPFGFLGLTRDGHLRDGGFLYHLSRFNPLSFLATAYVEIIRSTPVVVQVFIIYFGIFSTLFELPSIRLFGFIRFERFFPGVVALAMNSGAYLCEIIRSGIQSIAGRTCGSSFSPRPSRTSCRPSATSSSPSSRSPPLPTPSAFRTSWPQSTPSRVPRSSSWSPCWWPPASTSACASRCPS